MRVDPDQDRAGAGVEDEEGAEDRIVLQLGALLEQVGFPLDEQDRPWEDDGDKELSIERVSIVGDRPQGDPCAKRQAVLFILPFVLQIDHALLRAFVPALVPFLRIFLVWLHLDRKQAGHTVQSQTCGPEWNAGGQLGTDVDGEKGVRRAPLAGGPDHDLAVNGHVEGYEL